MDEQDYVLKAGFFIDGLPERLLSFSARVDLGPFQRPLTSGEIQEILFAAKMEYGRIIRSKPSNNTASDAATAPLIRKCCVHGIDLHRLCSRCAEKTGGGKSARLVCGPDPDGEPGYPPRR